MSTIKYTQTANLPEATHKATGRIGKIVNHNPIGEIGEMYELAFDGQIYTECFWDSEIELLLAAPSESGQISPELALLLCFLLLVAGIILYFIPLFQPVAGTL